jgi:hypothetical protein
MFYTNLGKERLQQNLQQMYNVPTIDIQAINGLNKAEELGLLDYDATDIEKGRKGMPIGAKAVWGGVSYLKTATGWKPVGKHRGNVKDNHDLIHNNDDKDKDHHAMVMDAGKMDEKEWTAKHGSNLHSKYKQVHEYLHKESKPKEEKKEEKPAEAKPEEKKSKTDLYHIKGQNGHIAVQVFHDTGKDQFGVDVSQHVKNADGTTNIKTKPRAFYPNSKKDEFIADLKNRGGEKAGDNKEQKQSEAKKEEPKVETKKEETKPAPVEEKKEEVKPEPKKEQPKEEPAAEGNKKQLDGDDVTDKLLSEFEHSKQSSASFGGDKWVNRIPKVVTDKDLSFIPKEGIKTNRYSKQLIYGWDKLYLSKDEKRFIVAGLKTGKLKIVDAGNQYNLIHA